MVGSSVPKATWSPAHREIFFDVCLDEVAKGNRPGTHFVKEGWINIVNSFYERTGARYSKKQLKNHWDFTKKQWKVWVKLVAERSMKWDPRTNKFGASASDWANYVQVYPEAAQFQYKELLFPEKLELIFAGVVDSEGMDISSSRKKRNGNSDSSPTQSEELDFSNVEGEDEHLFGTEDEHLFAVEDEHGFNSIVPMTNAEMTRSKLRSHREIGNEPSLSSSLQTKAKAVWTPEFHRAFLDLCVEETLKGNKPRTHFNRDGWKAILDSFQQRTGLSYNRLQLKNHWDITKEQWRVWSKLIGTSNMGWNPITKKFAATEELWANYLERNPEAAPFRYKELQFTDKLEIIFEGKTVTGETEPPTKRSKTNENSSASVLNIDERSMGNQDRNFEHFDAVPISFRQQSKLTYSIGECIDCLDAMEEVVQGSDLYLFALDVFLKMEYREIFLQLKKPNVRIAWLQRLQSVGPPLV